MNKTLQSFPPVSGPQAHTLILGSMPGVMSLEKQQYYVHPRNQFWAIMARIFEIPDHFEYEQKCRCLFENNIALWDVIDTCLRDGSLDSAIWQEQVNGFPAFFEKYPDIKRICFNGQKAYQSFKRYVLPHINESRFGFHILLSSSPANASWSFERKLAAWRAVLV